MSATAYPSFSRPAESIELEAARRHVRQLAGQIADLARSNREPEAFYPEFLTRVVEALGAYRGIVWRSLGQTRFELLTQVQRTQPEEPLEETLMEEWEQAEWHRGLLARSQQSPLAAPPQASPLLRPTSKSGLADQAQAQPANPTRKVFSPPDPPGENTGRPETPQGPTSARAVGNPTPWLLLLSPIETEGEGSLVVEIVQRREASLAAPRQLRFVAEMAELAGGYFRRRRLEQLRQETVVWQELETFARQVHARLDPAQTAYTFVNEGRRLIGCDRATVLVAEGKRSKVLAISGQAEWDPRSPVLRLLSRLVSTVLAGKEPIYYTGQTPEVSPQIESLLESYVDRTHTKALAIVPLWPTAELKPHPSPIDSDDLQAEPVPGKEHLSEPTRPIGAFVIERFEASEIPDSMRNRLEAVARHGETALSHSLHHHGIFLRPVWEALGRNAWVVWARTMPRLLWGMVAVALVVTGLLYTPARLEMEARGTLQPVVQQDVFAGIDGRVEKVLVAHRDRVLGPNPQTDRPGTLLCVLRSYELEEEMARLVGERATLEERLAAISRALLERQLPTVESDRLSAEQASVRQRLQSLDAQLALCRRKQEELSIHSPIDGEIITWDVAGLLLHRPVLRGDRLLRIAQTEGPWQVELEVPEDRIGHILQAQQNADSPLRVRFILAADPSKTYEGILQQIHSGAELRGSEGRSVLATVQIEKTEVSPLLPGSEVRAQVDCGRCSLGYRLFHDLIAWARRMWFQW